MDFYFEKPTQVKFIEKREEDEEPREIGGIAYKNEIICLECGGVIPCEDVKKLTPMEWADIHELIF